MLVGINGKLGSGKDTLAGFIIQHANKKWDNVHNLHVNMKAVVTQKSFAYKLKKMGAFLTATDEKLWFTQEGKNKFLPAWNMTIGEFQQKLGTEAVRNNVHTDAWVIALLTEYTGDENWIITDARFPNEADMIKRCGGIMIRIDGDPAKVRANSTRDLNHPSETALDNYENFDYRYSNDKSLEDLEKFASYIATKYFS